MDAPSPPQACLLCEAPTSRSSRRCKACDLEYTSPQRAILRLAFALVAGTAGYLAISILLEGSGSAQRDPVPRHGGSLILAPLLLVFLGHRLASFPSAPRWAFLCPHVALPVLIRGLL